MNSPEGLGRALPSYAAPKDVPGDYLDSLLAKQALCIKNAKHCWELVEEGFLSRNRNQFVTSPKGKSKLRRERSIGEAIFSPSVSATPSAVGDDAWPFLEWLVALFERDEELREQKEQGRYVQRSQLNQKANVIPTVRYSALFLDQLPPPRDTNSITRWDFSVISTVIVDCLGQTEQRQRALGIRLMHLVRLIFIIGVSLTLTTLLVDQFN